MDPDVIYPREPIEIDWPPKPAESARRRWLDWRTFVGGVGRIFIASGLLLFGFVAYQLWGTGIQQARSQDTLKDRFAQLLAPTTTAGSGSPAGTEPGGGTVPTSVAVAVPTSAPSASATEPTTTPGATPTPAATTPGAATAPATGAPTRATDAARPGDPVARLLIAKIGVDQVVVSGVGVDQLKKGPGHYPGTPLPGQVGNAAIAGHRSTFGAPFSRVDELARGDEIDVTTADGRFVYRVVDSRVVEPTEVSVIANTDDAELTLTSCWPKLSAAKRIVIRAKLDTSAAGTATPAPAPVPTSDATSAAPAPTTDAAAGTGATSADPATVGSAAPAATEAAPPASSGTDAFRQGWWSDDAAWGDVVAWGTALIVVGLAAWALSRRVRRNWVGASAGIGPFVVLLYFFYENVARLLPPNI